MRNNSYIVNDTKLKEDYDLDITIPKSEIEWELPNINFETDIPNWDIMSDTEKMVCRAVEDPFFFHYAILGYNGMDEVKNIAYPHQGEWLYALAKHKRCGIFAPVSHGKSICAATTYPIWSYLKNCNIRTAIISAREDLTKRTMRAIETHLVQNRRFIEIFNKRWGADPKPKRQKGITQTWSLQEKVCYRTKPIGVSDATFAGFSFSDKVFGMRFDLEIFDDIIQPLTYATKNPRICEDIILKLEEDWFTRFTWGKLSQHEVKVIGTFEDVIDIYHYMIEHYYDTWQMYRYRAISKKGIKHRIDITSFMKNLNERKKEGGYFEEFDVTTDDGI